jgi:hypothetical protein
VVIEVILVIVADQQGQGLEFTAFELAVLDAILTDDQPKGPDFEEFAIAGLEATEDAQRRVRAILRAQLKVAKITTRDFSGAGFFTNLAVPDTVERVPATRLVIGNVHVASPELENGAGSILFVDGGILNFLETFTYTDEMWKVPSTFTLSYPKWRRASSGMWISDLPRDAK